MGAGHSYVRTSAGEHIEKYAAEVLKEDENSDSDPVQVLDGEVFEPSPDLPDFDSALAAEIHSINLSHFVKRNPKPGVWRNVCLSGSYDVDGDWDLFVRLTDEMSMKGSYSPDDALTLFSLLGFMRSDYIRREKIRDLYPKVSWKRLRVDLQYFIGLMIESVKKRTRRPLRIVRKTVMFEMCVFGWRMTMYYLERICHDGWLSRKYTIEEAVVLSRIRLDAVAWESFPLDKGLIFAKSLMGALVPLMKAQGMIGCDFSFDMSFQYSSHDLVFVNIVNLLNEYISKRRCDV